MKVRFILLLWSGLCSACLLHGQAIIEQAEVEVFDQGVNDYPYAVGGYYGNMAYVMHRPAIRLSQGEFAYLWYPSKNSSYRDRILVKYNLILEELWRTEFELDTEEDIIHTFANDTAIVVLSYRYFFSEDMHRVFARTFSRDSGTVASPQIIHQARGKSNQYLLISPAIDDQSFLLYQYQPVQGKKRIRIFEDYLYTDETLGYRIIKAGALTFKHMDLNLNVLNEGTIKLNPLPRGKTYAVACQLDDDANIYVSLYDRPSNFRLIQYNCRSQQQKTLVFDEFKDYWNEEEPYYTHVPPVIGRNGKAYLGIAQREKVQGTWMTQQFEVLTFNFPENIIDRRRRIQTSSTLLVQVSKVREAFGMRPAKVFDQYLIRDVIEMPNGGIWLVTQKYEYDFYGRTYAIPTPPHAASYRIQELIMYEFDPLGKFTRALVIPSHQQLDDQDDYGSIFYRMNIDRERGEIDMFTHEMAGEEANEPPRTFYRKIDLNNASYTPRVQVFEGKRRTHHYFKHYTVWLNDQIVALMVEDGTTGDTRVLSLDLARPPELEPDEND